MEFLKGLLCVRKYKVKYFWKSYCQFPTTSVASLSVFFLFSSLSRQASGL